MSNRIYSAGPTRPARHTKPTCTANRCHQGRCACPCPQACELPAAPAAPPATGLRATALRAGAGAAFVVAVLLLVFLASGA